MSKNKLLRKMLSMFLVLIMVVSSLYTSFAADEGGIISGKIADWSFDEGAGTTVTDSVNAIAGTVSNGSWTEGVSGKAMQFNVAGANARISTTNEALNNLNTLSMGMWVNPDSSSANSTSILLSSEWSWDYSTTNSAHALQWAIYWDKDNYANSTMSVGVLGSKSTADPTYGGTYSSALGDIRDSWHYLAFSYDVDTKTVRYYLDGNLLNEVTYDLTAVYADLRVFQIGEWNWDYPPTRSFKGKLDELKIFNRVLTAEEILQLYNEMPLPTPTPTPTPTQTPGGSTSNLALNMPATASAGANPGASFDGNSNTRWSSGEGYNGDQWISVDLGTIQTINHVVVKWETAYCSDYIIQVSNDGSTWTDVYSGTNPTGLSNPVNDITFTQTSGQYLRVFCKAAGQVSWYGFSIWEVEVYNSSSAPTPTPAPEVTPAPSFQGEILFPFNEGNGSTSSAL
jgi:hypothetical protein